MEQITRCTDDERFKRAFVITWSGINMAPQLKPVSKNAHHSWCLTLKISFRTRFRQKVELSFS